MEKNYLIHGALAALGSAFCFALTASCIKLAAADLPVPVMVFLRSLMGLSIMTLLVAPRGFAYLKTGKLKFHILRGLLSMAAMSCFFFAIAHIGLAEATLLHSGSPLFIGFLAVLILGETLTMPIIFATVIGFIGVALILKPGTGFFTLGAMVGLVSGFFVACVKILIRYMSDTEPVLRTVFYFGLSTSLFSAIPLIWFWQTPSTAILLIIAIAGASATAGQMLLTHAFTHNPSAKIAPFSYTIVVIASLFGWIGWQEVPDMLSVLGALLVIGACVSMTLHGRVTTPWRKPPPQSSLSSEQT